MDIIYLLKVVFRRKWTILFCTMLGLAGGLIFKFFLPKQYVSTAQYSTGFAQTQKVSLSLTESFDVNQIDFRFNNVIETFKSPIVLAMMSYDLLLHDLEADHPFRTLTEKQRSDTNYLKSDIPKAKLILRDKLSSRNLLTTYDPQDKMVYNLLSLYEYDEPSVLAKLTVERVPRTDYINVSFSSENPELSAYVANHIGVKFKEFYIGLSSTSTKESLGKLDSLRESKRREVDTLRQRLKLFKDKGGTNSNDQQTAAVSAVQEVGSALTSQRASLNIYSQQLSTVIDELRELNANPATSATTPSVNNHADEILQLRRTNEELAAKLGQKGGVDPAISSQLDANNNRINQLSRASGVTASSPGLSSGLKIADRRQELQSQKLSLQASIAAARDNIAMYEGSLAKWQKIAFSGGGQTVVAEAYQNDLTLAQTALEKYNSSIFASQDIDISPDFNFKQILLGQPPIKPEPTKNLLIISISALSMFFLSSLFIVILELLDASLRTPSLFHKETNMAVLSSLGKIDLEKKTVRDYFEFSTRTERDDTAMPFIENLRKLRYEIERSGKRMILFTSTKAQEGKTTVMESLAHTFSLSKKKVLLIDANFSNNTLTRDFSAKPTLEGFTIEPHESVDRIWGITTLTYITNVDIIGCNEGNYTPSEVLPRHNLLASLDKLKQHYDFIFIEAAALNHHADSKEISEYTEGIVLVYSARNTLGEPDRDSMAFVKENKQKFIGAVLNNVDEQNLDL